MLAPLNSKIIFRRNLTLRELDRQTFIRSSLMLSLVLVAGRARLERAYGQH